MLDISTKCSVRGCSRSAGVTHLMCADHWRLVPLELRIAVIDNSLNRESERYKKAAEDAIKSIMPVE